MLSQSPWEEPRFLTPGALFALPARRTVRGQTCVLFEAPGSVAVCSGSHGKLAHAADLRGLDKWACPASVCRRAVAEIHEAEGRDSRPWCGRGPSAAGTDQTGPQGAPPLLSELQGPYFRP